MLPFSPQPIDQLQARFSRALRIRIDVTKRRIPNPRPSQLYSCVFDCEDGLRLIIARDRYVNRIQYHVSAGPLPGTKAAEFKPNSPELSEMAMERYLQISGEKEPLPFLGFSPDGYPHWGRDEPKEPADVRQPEV